MSNQVFSPEASQSELAEVVQGTKTYQVKDGRILRSIDGYEAMRQAVEKILRTVRSEWLIYSDQYGHDLDELIGQSVVYAKSEVVRMLREALLADDRVTEVSDVAVLATDKNSLSVSARVETVEGLVKIESEVSL